MPAVITITFSPCIDKSAPVKELLPEKKLKCSTPKLEPGGGGLNVARAIKKLGGEATAIFPCGGCAGKRLTRLMDIEEVPFVSIETSGETRENIIIFDESTNNQYRFGMPGTELSEQEWKQCLNAVAQMDWAEYIIVSGSLPPGVPPAVYAQLAAIAKRKHAKLIADAPGNMLAAVVEEGVFLIKPNLAELCALAGKEYLAQQEVKAAAQQIIAAKKCEIIVVSMGAAGAMLVTGNSAETIRAPQVIRKSTAGAGDSMVAGIVFYLLQGKSIFEAAQYGVACGTAATLNPGTELCRKEDVTALFELIRQK
jgi:6-phosphofructokinase 2